jgi:uncharacterized membrane protein YidH (DUF202 family)
MSKDETDEEVINNRLECSVLNWFRFALVLVTTAIIIVNFTNIDRLYGVIIFGLSAFLLAVRVINYCQEVSQLRNKNININIRFRTNAVVISMIPIIILIIWLMYKIWRDCSYF